MLGCIEIVDLQQSKVLTLNPEKKTATVIEIKNMTDEQKREADMFGEFRRLIQQAQQMGDESVEFLGKATIDGRSAIGYRVLEPGVDITVWASAETLLPIRLRYSRQMERMEYIISDIAYDVELDESLFSLEVPEGYTVHTVQMDVSEPKEEELLETLRMWMDAFGDIPEDMDIKKVGGKFPAALDITVAVGIMEFDATKAGFKKGMNPFDPKFQKYHERFDKAKRGIEFVHTLPDSSDWHYAGKDVILGDAGTAIFWYRPEGSPTYRVIYGDLSVKDVAPENVPK
jgi:hypothetical protein